MLIRPPTSPSVQYECVQPVKGLAHSYGLVVTSKGATLFVNGSDKRP